MKIKNDLFFVVFLCLFFCDVSAKTDIVKIKKDVIDYLYKLTNATIDFEQEDLINGKVCGTIFIKNDKIRVDYSDLNIIFVLNGNRFTYYDLDLDQISYFYNNSSVDINFFKTIIDNIDNIVVKNIENNFVLVELLVDNRKIFIRLGVSPLNLQDIEVYEDDSFFVKIFVDNIDFANNIDDKIFYLKKKNKKKGIRP